jgi:hypothetical protein
MAGYNFTTKNAVARIERIEQLIGMGFNTAAMIGEKINMPKGTYSHYLSFMRQNDLIHIASYDHGNRRGGYTPVYALGKPPTEDELLFGRDDYDHELRIFTKDWQDGTAHRDPLDAAFFGPVTQDSAGLNPSNTIKEEENGIEHYDINQHREFCRTIASVGTGFPVPATRLGGGLPAWALERTGNAASAGAASAI